MKKNLSKELVVVLTAIVILFAAGARAKDDQEIQKVIVINHKGYICDPRGPVTFKHEAHINDYGIACNSCHHEFEDGSYAKCIECHDPVRSDGAVKNLRLAFHMNCKGCHSKISGGSMSKKPPFQNCSGCHEKIP